MRNELIPKPTIAVALVLAFAGLAMAQNAPAPAASASPAPAAVATATPVPGPPMGEDDRLPFMQQQTPNGVAAPASEPSTGGLALKMIASLLFIVGLLFGGVWLVKKYAPGLMGMTERPEDATQLAVLNTVTLGAGRTIATVRFGDRVLLVGSTAQSFTLLAEDDQPAPVPVTRSVAEMLGETATDAAFAAEFERADNRLGGVPDGGRAS